MRTKFAAAAVAASAVAASANTMWIIENDTDTLWTVDVVTLQASQVGALGVDWVFGGLGFAGDTLYGYNTGDSGLYTIDTATGAATLVGNDVSAEGVDSFDINPITGQAVGLGADEEAWEFNLADGDATLLSTPPLNGGFSGIAFDGNGTLFSADRFDNILLTVDPNSGAVNTVGGFGQSLGNTSVGYNFADGSLYTFRDFANNDLFRIDPTTGAATLVGTVSGLPASDGDQQYTAATFQIPGPGAAALAGLAGLAAVRRRR